MDYKHYIRLNSDGNIIKAFCDAFEKPVDGDILYCETNERHFLLEVYDMNGFPRYAFVDGEIVERTELTEAEQTELNDRAVKEDLARSDSEIIRGIDDLLVAFDSLHAVLVKKEIITEKEQISIDADLRNKISERAALRSQLKE